MEAHIKMLSGLSLVGKGSTNHWIPMDASEDLGGSNAASRPMELLLIGLGGCTGMDVLSIMQKMKVPFDDFEIKLDAERSAEHPKVFTKIKIKFIIYGKNINEKNVQRAIELSETKYCGASAMLKHTAQIETSYSIIT
jgi:putative redox protein